MSEAEYYKCACKECGNNIEFPASAARTTITCPHCGQWTELIVEKNDEEEEEADESGVRIKLIPLLICVVLLGAAGGGYWFWQHQKNSPASDNTSPAPPVKITAAPVKPIVIVPGSPTPQSVTQAVEQVTPKKPTRPKSIGDLKVGSIELEKTKGSSLVYAVGTMKNDSDYDRYGVRVELDLFNAKGTKIGAAKDYKDYIGPNQEWQFRALIPEPKATEARVASVKED